MNPIILQVFPLFPLFPILPSFTTKINTSQRTNTSKTATGHLFYLGLLFIMTNKNFLVCLQKFSTTLYTFSTTRVSSEL